MKVRDPTTWGRVSAKTEASRGRTVSRQRLHTPKLSRTAMRNRWQGFDSWSDKHGRGWHFFCERFGKRHKYSVILPKEWVPWIPKARSHVPSDVSRILASDVSSCLWRPGMPIVAMVGHAASGGPPIMARMPCTQDGMHCETMLSWGIATREDLSEWIHNQGFVQPRWSAHFCARAQERMTRLRSSRVSVRADHVAGMPARFAPGTIPQPVGKIQVHQKPFSSKNVFITDQIEREPNKIGMAKNIVHISVKASPAEGRRCST